MTSEPIGTACRISPYARRLAAQLGIPMADLVGTGPGGEVGAKDVRRAGAARSLRTLDRRQRPEPRQP
jgi:pyruvate/2-oxoglutarate dehydrogenase complex dihydrolipoamide acyltransferase (E2) component